MTRNNFKEKSMKSALWSQNKHPTDNIRTQEDPTTLTTHPTTYGMHLYHYHWELNWLLLKLNVDFPLQFQRCQVSFFQQLFAILGFGFTQIYNIQTILLARINLAKNLCIYVNFRKKLTYTEKKVVKIMPRVKTLYGSVNGWTYY